MGDYLTLVIAIALGSPESVSDTVCTPSPSESRSHGWCAALCCLAPVMFLKFPQQAWLWQTEKQFLLFPFLKTRVQTNWKTDSNKSRKKNIRCLSFMHRMFSRRSPGFFLQFAAFLPLHGPWFPWMWWAQCNQIDGMGASCWPTFRYQCIRYRNEEKWHRTCLYVRWAQ